MIFYGQLIIGPPGSGKTTYCHGMKMFIETLGRDCVIINLDFANDLLPYDCAVDVRELVSLERVMEEFGLGPNGGLIYCMEYLLENFEWLEEKLQALSCRYILFDCPGQVELYTHHTSVHKIIEKLQCGSRSGRPQDLDCRLCSVHLIDSYYCSMPATFISAVLLVVSTMMRLALPHVSVLSKVDLLHHYGELPFNLDFYTEMTSLYPLTRYIDGKMFSDRDPAAVDEDEDDETDDSPVSSSGPASLAFRPSPTPSPLLRIGVTPRELMGKKLRKMAEGLCEVLDDVGLISFIAMNVQDGETVNRVLGAVDRANGFSFSAYDIRSKTAVGSPSSGDSESGKGNGKGRGLMNLIDSGGGDSLETAYSRTLEIQEKYTGNSC